ncbi:MAG: Methylated-DNA/protein-cysteine methyltransferase [Candidatus Moranbacteria bacterium GW2011_GWF2_36_839]|nr:MAG: Methylated-DNA/protein-cysteine methyltransferase [Candidatus Moranbacteria bacterium GW2011_GWF1_36_78]KKQ17237.1 MAG: Methylated-DNA/protein-cysteine methyltransferase [Candidatus Moranbacteria bacterium GW2011_GWF2_36_839]HAT73755.1 6-O-methylguanine DNA methyltransferase [Candidatus Moranbacteria bacterium]HBY11256.1 6-O-methylguanine DNA methyltransferase [Candidatus Moranbacteria bacterium]
MKKSFQEKVLEIVGKIPIGKVLTYKKVAKEAGNPKAYRAVGNILHKNHNLKIPCHRVICSNGEIGGYNRGEKEKRKLLTREGIIIK